MRKLLLLICLILSSSSYAQQNFDDLFMDTWEQCPQWIMQNYQHLNREFDSQDSLEYWLDTWELFCEPTVASIRLRLLGDIQFKGLIAEDIDLKAFHKAQIEFVRSKENLSAIFAPLSEYQSKQASKLLETKDWPLREEFLLKSIAAADYDELLDLYYQRRYQKLETVKGLKSGIEESPDELINLAVGFNHLQFNQDLERLLASANGLWLGLEIEDQNNLLSIAMSLNLSQEKAYVRILGADKVERTDLEVLFLLDFNYGRKIWSSRRQQVHLLMGGGIGDFNTDLSYLNSDGERIPIGIGSYHFNTGLNYSWRIYGSYEIGLRALVSFTDYNRDEDLRSSLNGQTLQTCLYYRF